MLNGNQRLMYCGLLTPIHGTNLNPVWGAPQAPSPFGARVFEKQRAPPCEPGRGSVTVRDCYLAGAFDESDFVAAALVFFL